MVRLLLEDVTLLKGEELTLHVRFKGGATQTLTQPKALAAHQLRKTKDDLIQAIDRLIDQATDAEIASQLNEKGFRSGGDHPLTRGRVSLIRRTYKLKNRYQRLRETGMLTQTEMAERLKISINTVQIWRRYGVLRAQTYNDRGECLYEPPTANPPQKQQGLKCPLRIRAQHILTQSNQRGAV